MGNMPRYGRCKAYFGAFYEDVGHVVTEDEKACAGSDKEVKNAERCGLCSFFEPIGVFKNVDELRKYVEMEKIKELQRLRSI
ncbi:MAG: hypothetical protein ACXQTZ_00530 [Candidatus Alkanophagales archaeon]